MKKFTFFLFLAMFIGAGTNTSACNINKGTLTLYDSAGFNIIKSNATGGKIISWDFLVRPRYAIHDQSKHWATIYFDSALSNEVTVHIVDSANNCSDSVTLKFMSKPHCSMLGYFYTFPIDTLKNTAKINRHLYMYNPVETWYYGDGTSSSTYNPYHSYTNPGTYTIKNVIQDTSRQNCIDSFERTVTVKSCYVSADFQFFDTFYVFNFYNYSQNANRFYWDFGDSNTSTSSQSQVNHYYNRYTPTYVTLIAYDDIYNKCSDTIVKQVLGQSCRASAKFSYSSKNVGVYDFYSHSTAYANRFEWDFGDGTGAQGVLDATHTYTTTGYYHVVFYAYDTNFQNCRDTFAQTIYVNMCRLSTKADFNLRDSFGYVTFTNLSIGNNLKYYWAIYDNNQVQIDSMRTKDGLLYYSGCGTKYVTLHILDSISGCMDDISKSITIVPFKAKFSIVPDTSQNYSGIIIDQSINASGLNYQWDFGDGDTSHNATPTHTYTGTGPYRLCLHIFDNSTCFSNFCDTIGFDSSGQLQMIMKPFSLKVVQDLDKYYSLDENELSTRIKLYPNPASQVLNLSSDGVELSGIEIYSMNGQKVITLEIDEMQEEISVTHLNNGVYFYRIQAANGVYATGKIVINR